MAPSPHLSQEPHRRRGTRKNRVEDPSSGPHTGRRLGAGHAPPPPSAKVPLAPTVGGAPERAGRPAGPVFPGERQWSRHYTVACPVSGEWLMLQCPIGTRTIPVTLPTSWNSATCSAARSYPFDVFAGASAKKYTSGRQAAPDNRREGQREESGSRAGEGAPPRIGSRGPSASSQDLPALLPSTALPWQRKGDLEKF